MATETLQSSTLTPGGFTQTHPEDLIVRAECLSDLMQWIESARAYIAEAEYKLKGSGLVMHLDWSDNESYALIQLHMMQADALKTARAMVNAGSGWPTTVAPAQ